MDLNLLILEVDGSLHNPAVAWSIAIWLAIAVVIGVFAARYISVSGATILLLFLFVVTPFITHGIARLFYTMRSSNIVAVHFWGFSRAQWLAPSGAVLSLIAVRSLRARRQRRNATFRKAG